MKCVHALLILLLLPLMAVANQGLNYSKSDESARTSQLTPNPRLLNLPANKWIKFYQPKHGKWRRPQHAGIAYDTKRGTLLVFGSDTHSKDWDNSVHEFSPFTETWTQHYKSSPPKTYRADNNAYAIAGTEALRPWAMHTYDGIVYDPMRDALVVMARPNHNPHNKNLAGVKRHPAWLYDLTSHTWKIIKQDSGPPKFFDAAAAYDDANQQVVAYKYGIWRLDSALDEWQQITKKHAHQSHYSLVYDKKHNKFLAFGHFRHTNKVWAYTPSSTNIPEGAWQELSPGGDDCPTDEHLPAAFSQDQGVTLLVADNNEYKINEKGKRKKIRAKSSSTFAYDLALNQYTKLPEANLPSLDMNYMMVYDPIHKVFLLVTGNWKAPPAVWALRLDLDLLPQTQP